MKNQPKALMIPDPKSQIIFSKWLNSIFLKPLEAIF